MTNLELEDIVKVANLPYHWEKLKNKTIMISGGTGFIGSFISNVIRYKNEKYNYGIKIISLSRRGGISDEYVKCLKADITQPISYGGTVDYIIKIC